MRFHLFLLISSASDKYNYFNKINIITTYLAGLTHPGLEDINNLRTCCDIHLFRENREFCPRNRLSHSSKGGMEARITISLMRIHLSFPALPKPQRRLLLIKHRGEGEGLKRCPEKAINILRKLFSQGFRLKT